MKVTLTSKSCMIYFCQHAAMTTEKGKFKKPWLNKISLNFSAQNISLNALTGLLKLMAKCKEESD